QNAENKGTAEEGSSGTQLAFFLDKLNIADPAETKTYSHILNISATRNNTICHLGIYY
ncbi:hypothetical protein HK099_003728, partial [Clydaea vesicula]